MYCTLSHDPSGDYSINTMDLKMNKEKMISLLINFSPFYLKIKGKIGVVISSRLRYNLHTWMNIHVLRDAPTD